MRDLNAIQITFNLWDTTATSHGFDPHNKSTCHTHKNEIAKCVDKKGRPQTVIASSCDLISNKEFEEADITNSHIHGPSQHRYENSNQKTDSPSTNITVSKKLHLKKSSLQMTSLMRMTKEKVK
jgi:hypothetical protein